LPQEAENSKVFRFWGGGKREKVFGAVDGAAQGPGGGAGGRWREGEPFRQPSTKMVRGDDHVMVLCAEARESDVHVAERQKG